MRFKRWLTNCPGDDAFELLMRYSAADPDGYYMIGPPHETKSMCSRFTETFGGLGNWNGKGCTVEDLEKIDYLGIYECHPPDFPYDS